jgi:hypothetical protein
VTKLRDYGIGIFSFRRGLLQEQFDLFEDFVLSGFIPIDNEVKIWDDFVEVRVVSTKLPFVQQGKLPPRYTLVINTSNPKVRKFQITEEFDASKVILEWDVNKVQPIARKVVLSKR